MKLSIFDRSHEIAPEPACEIERHGATLRIAGPAPRTRSWEPVVIRGGEWPSDADAVSTSSVQVKAEITAKRFLGNSVSQDRYEATFQAFDGSPSSLISALSAACAAIDDFRSVNGTDERVILQINLIQGG
jgi:hypothetical protein